MACFPTPPLFDAPLGRNPLKFKFLYETTTLKLEGWGYRVVKIS